MIDIIPVPPSGRIAAPGFYRLRAADYHADLVVEPSLSSSLALTLVADTPAHAKVAHPRLTTQVEEDSNKAMDMGSVVHELVLGAGGGFDVLNFKDYKSAAAKEAAKASRTRGRTPILASKYVEAEQTAEAIRAGLRCIPEVQSAFALAQREIVMAWQDVGGVWCRTMADMLVASEIQATFLDIKTTARGLGDRTLTSKIADGLDLRAAFYARGLSHLLPHLAGRIKFMWIFAEIDAPYEVRIIEATREMLDLGDRKTAYAIELWRRCRETNLWPGYPRKVERLPYPAWAEAQWLAREISDEGSDIAAASHPLSRARPLERAQRIDERMLTGGLGG